MQLIRMVRDGDDIVILQNALSEVFGVMRSMGFNYTRLPNAL